MVKDNVTIGEVVDVLNRAIAEDRDAVNRLMQTRVPCNKALADDPTIQVLADVVDGKHVYKVGLLGVLNGLFGCDPVSGGALIGVWGVVCTHCDFKVAEGMVVGDSCVGCGEELSLGDLLYFKSRRKKE
jgi:hypothetical protein